MRTANAKSILYKCAFSQERSLLAACIIGLFGYCKGGTSLMGNLDWSTLDIGKS